MTTFAHRIHSSLAYCIIATMTKMTMTWLFGNDGDIDDHENDEDNDDDNDNDDDDDDDDDNDDRVNAS